MIRQRGRPQPRIAEAHLRKLSSLATRYGIQMTHLLNLIVATALEELEQAADVGDEGKMARSTVQGQAHRLQPEGVRRPGDTAHTPSRAHDRHRLPRSGVVRHRHHR